MKPRMSASTKLKLLMPVLYAVAAAIYFAVAMPEQPKTHHIVGLLLTFVSFYLWILARVQLGNAFSIAPKSKYLVISGLYSKLRHPVYYFSVTAIIGVSLFVWHPAMVVLTFVLFALELFRMNKEEKLLSDTFGKEYVEYKQRTWL